MHGDLLSGNDALSGGARGGRPGGDRHGHYAAMDVKEPNALVESINLPEKDLELILKGKAMRLLKI